MPIVKDGSNLIVRLQEEKAGKGTCITSIMLLQKEREDFLLLFTLPTISIRA